MERISGVWRKKAPNEKVLRSWTWDLEWYLVNKGEGAAGSVLGGGSFLRREGMPGTRKKASVERRRRFSWFQENGLRGEVSG